jgi:hypothetical protein
MATKTEAQRRNTANKELAAISRKLHIGIPVKEIADILKKHEFDPVAMDGIYTGHTGKMNEQCGKRTWIFLSWYKMPNSGKYEVTTYVS